ncbi:protein ELF4-LIKE 3-like [Musa acuminata AAA Group]|uniref:protein ELF4-LIKE 3-like n=1 Tax=Musa acuminata AAA Group TaxID=214697 RepID=UPI0031DEF849
MEGGETFPVLGNGSQGDDKVMQTFHKSFGQVQSRLDQNRKLINEINQNQASRIPGRLNRNVRLIEVNSNIRRVVDVYVELSLSFTGSMEASPEAGAASQGKPGHKRVRA